MVKRENNGRWNGGRTICKNYMYVLRPHHKFATVKGYVLEHRYIIELDLGRYLTKNEVVHHVDGNKLNNEENNLKLMSHSEHSKITNTKINPSNRICNICKSDKTWLRKTGSPQWHIYEDNKIICVKCRSKIYYHNKIKKNN